MRRGAAAFAAVCLLWGPSAPVRAQSERAALFELARSLVKVEAADARGRYFVGTGTVVQPGTVVTACHVIRTAARVDILHGGLRYPAAGQWVDADHDVCLLKVPRLEVAPAAVGRSETLTVGDRVTAIGFTGGLGLAPALGSVERLYAFDGAKVVLTDAGFTSGASGGGLFDGAGHLVGLLTFRMRGPGAQFFAVPAEWFTALLARDEPYRPVGPFPNDAPPFWRRDAEALPYFMRAHSLDAEHRWDDLRSLAEHWHAALPGDAEALFWLGWLEAQRQAPQAAIERYRAAVSLDPGHAHAWFQLGMTYLAAGQVADAKAVVAPLREASPSLSQRLFEALPETTE